MLSCEKCGRPLPKEARFCGVCGHPIKKRLKKEDKVKAMIPEEAAISPTMDTDLPKVRPREEPGLHEIPVLTEESIPPSVEAVGEEIEVPDEMIMILYARKRAPELKQELKTQMEELDALSEKMDVGILTKKEAMEQLKGLKKTIAQLQAEQAQLDEAASVSLEIENFYQEQKKLVEWVTKLKELKKSGKVSDSVFQKMMREYEENRNQIELQLNEQVLRLKQWANILQKKAKKLTQEQETLRIRLQVEGHPPEDTKKQMKETEKELEKIKFAEEQARAILQKIL